MFKQLNNDDNNLRPSFKKKPKKIKNCVQHCAMYTFGASVLCAVCCVINQLLPLI